MDNYEIAAEYLECAEIAFTGYQNRDKVEQDTIVHIMEDLMWLGIHLKGTKSYKDALGVVNWAAQVLARPKYQYRMAEIRLRYLPEMYESVSDQATFARIVLYLSETSIYLGGVFTPMGRWASDLARELITEVCYT
jgi:hypothetical protein